MVPWLAYGHAFGFFFAKDVKKFVVLRGYFFHKTLFNGMDRQVPDLLNKASCIDGNTVMSALAELDFFIDLVDKRVVVLEPVVA